mgnify:CR=1 FL=1
MIKLKNKFLHAVLLSFLFTITCCMPVFAVGEDIIQTGFDVIYSIIAAIVSSVGSLLLLWGFFEWAQSLNTQDGGVQNMAFRRIGGGLVAVVVPQLIPVIQNAISTTP